MKYSLDDELKHICSEIIGFGMNESEWAETESSDMFQSKNYNGGFDGIENEFCFSVYIDGEEFWFQVSLKEVEMISNGDLGEVELREAGR